MGRIVFDCGNALSFLLLSSIKNGQRKRLGFKISNEVFMELNKCCTSYLNPANLKNE